GGPHVVHDHDGRRPGQRGERGADRLGDAFVQLVGDDPPDVVRLEDLRIVAHAGPCLPCQPEGTSLWRDRGRGPAVTTPPPPRRGRGHCPGGRSAPGPLRRGPGRGPPGGPAGAPPRSPAPPVPSRTRRARLPVLRWRAPPGRRPASAPAPPGAPAAAPRPSPAGRSAGWRGRRTGRSSAARHRRRAAREPRWSRGRRTSACTPSLACIPAGSTDAPSAASLTPRTPAVRTRRGLDRAHTHKGRPYRYAAANAITSAARRDRVLRPGGKAPVAAVHSKVHLQGA